MIKNLSNIVIIGSIIISNTAIIFGQGAVKNSIVVVRARDTVILVSIDSTHILNQMFSEGISLKFQIPGKTNLDYEPYTQTSYCNSNKYFDIINRGSDYLIRSLQDNYPCDSLKIDVYETKDEDNAEPILTIELVFDGYEPIEINSVPIDTSENITPKVNGFDCNLIQFADHECSNQMTREKLFGEDSWTYTNDKVVYILDFENQGQDPSFYKIFKRLNDKKGDAKNKPFEPCNGLDGCIEKDGLYLVNLETGREKLQSKSRVEFKVVNVNKFRYNVSVFDSAAIFDSDVPFLFTDLFLGSKDGTLGKLIQTYTSNLSAHDKVESLEITDKLNQLLSRIDCFYRNLSSIQNFILNSIGRCNHFPCCPEHQDLYLGVAKDLLNLRAEIASILELEAPALMKELKDMETTFENCKKADAIQQEINKLRQEVKREKALLKPDQKVIDEKEDSIALKDKTVQELLKGETCLDLSVMRRNISAKRSELAPYLNLQIMLDSLPSDAQIQKLILRVNSITKNAFKYVNHIPQLRGLSQKIDIRIEAKEPMHKLDPSSTSDSFHYVLDIPIINKWLVSFSSGAFIGFGEDIQPKTYNFRAIPITGFNVDSSKKYELVESGFDEIPYGFAALSNLQYQIDRGFGLGVSVGVGITVEKKPKPAYLGGLSLSFGRERQLVLTGGAMFTPVSILKPTVSKDFLYDNDTYQIEYYDDLRVGGFVSITYTPFKIKKQ